MDIRWRTKSVIVTFTLVAAAIAQTDRNRDYQVTAVSGPSWLSHLHRTLNQSSMGQTWRYGPSDSTSPKNIATQPPRAPLGRSAAKVTLHGEDVYRLNCRGCHGESGEGAPPEINSLLNPVRATSASLIIDRMRKAGMDVTASEAGELARQSRTALLQRLHHGGEEMPAFPHLRDDEIHVLIGHLRRLAGVPGAEQEQGSVQVSPPQVGEQIVKSTCHTCHSAEGENPTPQQLSEGAIPPLSTLTSRVSQTEFIRKVTHGAPIVMGTPVYYCRGRMPVFYYLSEEEASDVYLYLTLYPPQRSAKMGLVAGLISPVEGEIPAPPAKASEPAGFFPDSRDLDLVATTGLFIGLILVLLLLGGALWFTLRELKRLSGEVDDRRPITVQHSAETRTLS